MKKRITTHVLAIIFGCFLVVGCDGPAEEAGEKIDEAVVKQQEQLAEALREIGEAKEEISRLQKKLQEALQQRDEARTQLEAMKQERQRFLEEIEKSEKFMEEQSDNPTGEQKSSG